MVYRPNTSKELVLSPLISVRSLLKHTPSLSTVMFLTLYKRKFLLLNSDCYITWSVQTQVTIHSATYTGAFMSVVMRVKVSSIKNRLRTVYR